MGKDTGKVFYPWVDFSATRVLFILFFSDTSLFKNLHVQLNTDTYSCHLKNKTLDTVEKEEYRREEFFCSTEALMVENFANA